jgi:hypothetical protein
MAKWVLWKSYEGLIEQVLKHPPTPAHTHILEVGDEAM